MLLLVTQWERAGAQKVALMQARYFYLNGYKVIFCVFYDKYGSIEELRTQEPYPIINLEAKSPGFQGRITIARFLRALWRFYKLLRRERVDIVETLTHYSNVLGIIVAWLARVPVRISSQHGILSAFPRWFLALDACLVNSPLVDRMIAVSEQAYDFCINTQKMRREKLEVILNGIDLNNFNRSRWPPSDLERLRQSLSIPSSAVVLTTVARFHAIKGHCYLLRAASVILEAHPEVIFLWVGDGELRLELEQAIHYNELSAAVRLTGIRDDVPQLLALSTLFVLPSLSEAMPMGILEAMAANLPVVATAVGGVKSLVIDGETGLLVPPADPPALSRAILTLLNDLEHCHQMGQKGYEHVREHFSEQAMCQQYENVIRTIMSQKAVSKR